MIEPAPPGNATSRRLAGERSPTAVTPPAQHANVLTLPSARTIDAGQECVRPLLLGERRSGSSDTQATGTDDLRARRSTPRRLLPRHGEAVVRGGRSGAVGARPLRQSDPARRLLPLAQAKQALQSRSGEEQEREVVSIETPASITGRSCRCARAASDHGADTELC